MKKVLASFLAVGLMATVANAELIGLRWADTPGVATHVGPGTVEVYLKMQGTAEYHGDSAGVIFTFKGANAATAPAENLIINGFATSIPTWSPGGVQGAAGIAQFAVGGNTVLQGPGEFVLGTFNVSFSGPADLSIKALTANIPADPAGLLTGAGAKYVWNANLATGPSGYGAVAFDAAGFGNPGWGTMPALGHQPTANPLFIQKVPEPTSLALVALGGFALLRRRN